MGKKEVDITSNPLHPLDMERKSYIDRIFAYGCKRKGAVAHGHPRLQIKGAVAKQTFIARYKNFAVEFIVPIEFSSALRRIHSIL